MHARRKRSVISLGKGGKKRIVSDSRPEIKIDGRPVRPQTSRAVDLVFVIDTTGSMSDKIDGLLRTCARFADEFAALGLDHRVAVMAFGDLTVPGDKIESTPFTARVEVTKKSLQNIPRYGGGGNEGESSLEALEKAMALPFRRHVVKAIILITDEPALQHNMTASDMISRLLGEEALAFVISPPLSYFKKMAVKSGGRWYQVAASTDFTDLLEMFQELARDVSRVVSETYRIGDGSVAKYRRLKPPEA
ncbi:MAG: VWA domain-containing protein [bacterium]